MRELKKILFVVGLIVVFGTAGALDLDNITILQGALQGITGLGLMAIGAM